jgi:IS5 family transposase
VRQQSLAAQSGFERYGKKTRREQFLEEMERVVPWAELEALVRPHYPKGENGRPPMGLGIMLRIHFLQQWFNLSDPGAEEALYDSAVLRRFAGIDLGRAPAPDETTILQFRHLLEAHDLGGAMLDTVNRYLDSRGIRIATGTIVDATIIHAPSSTKNASGKRDPEMHQTRKGKQWYFGLKAHIGVDSRQGIVHSVCTSAASVADKHMLPDLLHGDERKVCPRVSDAIREFFDERRTATWSTSSRRPASPSPPRSAKRLLSSKDSPSSSPEPCPTCPARTPKPESNPPEAASLVPSAKRQTTS